MIGGSHRAKLRRRRGVATSPCKGEVGREAAGRGSRFAQTPEQTARARSLRRTMTDVEKKLWYALRRNQIGGLNFRRQHPTGRYVLDFYCPALRLAIELDGGQHAEDRQHANDARRTRWLESKGIVVLRFWNNDVTGNLNGVLEESARVGRERREPPSPTLPLSGRGMERPSR